MKNQFFLLSLVFFSTSMLIADNACVSRSGSCESACDTKCSTRGRKTKNFCCVHVSDCLSAGKIKTGTLDAGTVDAGNLNVGNILASGNIAFNPCGQTQLNVLGAYESCLQDIRGTISVTGVSYDPNDPTKVVNATLAVAAGSGFSINAHPVGPQNVITNDVTALVNSFGVTAAAVQVVALVFDIIADKPFVSLPTPVAGFQETNALSSPTALVFAVIPQTIVIAPNQVRVQTAVYIVGSTVADINTFAASLLQGFSVHFVTQGPVA